MEWILVTLLALMLAFLLAKVNIRSWLSFFYKIWRLPSLPGALPLVGHCWSIYQISQQEPCSLATAWRLLLLRADPSLTVFKMWFFCVPIICFHSAKTTSQLFRNPGLPKPQMGEDMAQYFGGGMLTSTGGSTWKYHHNVVKPAFKMTNLNRMADVVAKVSNQFMRQEIESAIRETSGLINNINRMALDLVIKVLIISSVPIPESEIDQHYDAAFFAKISKLMELGSDVLIKRIVFFFIPDWLFLRLAGKVHELIDSMKLMVRQTAALIEKYAVPNADPTFLSLILKETKTNPDKFTEDEMIGEFLTLVGAGTESVSTTLTWFFHVIGNRLDIQSKIQEELDNLFPDSSDRPASLSDIKQMKYLEATVKECLRRYTTITVIFRSAHTDLLIVDEEGREFLVPEGSGLLINLEKIEQDSRYYIDPLLFDPERFLQPYESTAFVPFGGGHRVCLGQKFAMIELLGILSSVMRKYQFTSDQPLGNLRQVSKTTLSPDRDVRVRFQRRK